MTSRHLTGFVFLLALAGTAAADSSSSTREFLNGHCQTFSTKGHAKAKGVDCVIAYPSSWAAEEGERPYIVQKFVSEGGRGLEMVMIVATDLSLPAGTVLSEQDQKDFFSSPELRELLPPNATFIAAQPTKIETIPAGILEYKMRAERAGMALLFHTWSLNFLSGNTLVQVQFSVGGLAGTETDVSRRMGDFKPLFTLMANSIRLPDTWTAAPETLTGSATPLASSSSPPSDHPDHLFLTLAVSFIVATFDQVRICAPPFD